MHIIAQLLFGSHARGDSTPSSDVDILSVMNEGSHATTNIGNINVSYYSKDHLLADAKSGDLFVMHIAREAKPMFDAGRFLPKLRTSFVQRRSYGEVARNASDLCRFICRTYDDFVEPAFANKRIAWCIRTILIAKSVDAGKPAFSPRELSKFAGRRDVESMFSIKGIEGDASFMFPAVIRFLDTQGYGEPLEIQQNDFRSAWRYFVARNNNIALKTISRTTADLAVVGY